jgi:hypothetical protein
VRESCETARKVVVNLMYQKRRNEHERSPRIRAWSINKIQKSTQRSIVVDRLFALVYLHWLGGR